jgi:hypothetical protein
MVRLTADDLLRGLLAALVVNESKDVSGTRPEIHRAFYRVLKSVGQAPLAHQIEVNLDDVDFDPLYGQSRWLDRALTRAQRGRVVSFPNPTYELMQVQFGREEAAAILEDLRAREPFIELARLFASQLSRDEPSTVTA